MPSPKWSKPGTVFTVPLLDGTFSLGQTISHEPDALGSVFVVLFDQRYEQPPTGWDKNLSERNIVTAQLTTPDQLRNKGWPCIDQAPLVREVHVFPKIDAARASGFIGVKIIGSGILTSLLGAFHGLEPWDKYHDPEYLDKLLYPGRSRPTTVIVTRDQNA